MVVRERIDTWAFELEWYVGKGGRRRGGKKTDPYLLIKAVDVKRPLTSLKSRLFPRGHVNITVG